MNVKGALEVIALEWRRGRRNGGGKGCGDGIETLKRQKGLRGAGPVALFAMAYHEM